ncbi:MAG TPA: hypothetical protein VK699_19030 [Terriglobales bacterium]|nr:hypothetical protein [Terriglobales bacterium]
MSVKSLSLVPRLEQKLQPKLNASQELIIAGGVEESYFSPKNDAQPEKLPGEDSPGTGA